MSFSNNKRTKCVNTMSAGKVRFDLMWSESKQVSLSHSLNRNRAVETGNCSIKRTKQVNPLESITAILHRFQTSFKYVMNKLSRSDLNSGNDYIHRSDCKPQNVQRHNFPKLFCRLQQLRCMEIREILILQL